MSVRKLRRFRQQCEQEAGQPATEIELPLLHVLADVCATLGLSKSARRKVLGRKGMQRLDDFRKWRVSVKK